MVLGIFVGLGLGGKRFARGDYSGVTCLDCFGVFLRFACWLHAIPFVVVFGFAGSFGLGGGVWWLVFVSW